MNSKLNKDEYVIASFTFDVVMTKKEYQEIQENHTQTRNFQLPKDNGEMKELNIESLHLSVTDLEDEE